MKLSGTLKIDGKMHQLDAGSITLDVKVAADESARADGFMGTQIKETISVSNDTLTTSTTTVSSDGKTTTSETTTSDSTGTTTTTTTTTRT
ncbi:MAG: hypothetical protein ABI563_14300 [Specibacter sp.]